jgi:hypothetical protein
VFRLRRLGVGVQPSVAIAPGVKLPPSVPDAEEQNAVAAGGRAHG